MQPKIEAIEQLHGTESLGPNEIPMEKRGFSLVPNPCLWRSRFLYYFCKAMRMSGDFRICIGLQAREKNDSKPIWGHAWLNRDGKPYCENKLNANDRWLKVGERGHYDYYILNNNG